MSSTKNRPENCEELNLQTDDIDKPKALLAMAIGLESFSPVVIQAADIKKKDLLKESQDRFEKMNLKAKGFSKPSNNWKKEHLRKFLEAHPRKEEADINFITTTPAKANDGLGATAEPEPTNQDTFETERSMSWLGETAEPEPTNQDTFEIERTMSWTSLPVAGESRSTEEEEPSRPGPEVPPHQHSDLAEASADTTCPALQYNNNRVQSRLEELETEIERRLQGKTICEFLRDELAERLQGENKTLENFYSDWLQRDDANGTGGAQGMDTDDGFHLFGQHVASGVDGSDDVSEDLSSFGEAQARDPPSASEHSDYSMSCSGLTSPNPLRLRGGGSGDDEVTVEGLEISIKNETRPNQTRPDLVDDDSLSVFTTGDVVTRAENRDQKEERVEFADNGYYEGTLLKNMFHGVGKRVWANGDSYEGEWQEDNRHGKGKYCWSNGDSYEGEYRNGLRDGQGRFVWADGGTFEGSFVCGKKKGQGRRVLANGEEYDGQWENDKPHGRGKWIHPSGAKHEGEYCNGLREGPGRWDCADGGYYDGWFAKNKVNGFGKSVRADGAAYEGEWKDGKPHGKGKHTWPKGDEYTGQYTNGVQQGHGRYTFADGGYYEGDFVNGAKEGLGRRVWPSNEEYEGEWKENKPHGKGTYTWPSGNRYNGEYRNGFKEGQGRYTFADDGYYEGTFVRDMFAGHGTRVWASGESYEGEWKANKRHGQEKTRSCSGVECEGEYRNGLILCRGRFKLAGSDDEDSSAKKSELEIDEALREENQSNPRETGDDVVSEGMADIPVVSGPSTNPKSVSCVEPSLYNPASSRDNNKGANVHTREASTTDDSEILIIDPTGLLGLATKPTDQSRVDSVPATPSTTTETLHDAQETEDASEMSATTSFNETASDLAGVSAALLTMSLAPSTRETYHNLRETEGAVVQGEEFTTTSFNHGAGDPADESTAETSLTTMSSVPSFSPGKSKGYKPGASLDSKKLAGQKTQAKSHNGTKEGYREPSGFLRQVHNKVRSTVKNKTLTDKAGMRGKYSGSCVRHLGFQRVPDGQGTMEYKNGDRYKGGWSNGLWHGHGELKKFKDGSYVGDFIKGQFCGQGIRRWADGSEHRGRWEAGIQSGRGTFRTTNGDVLEGIFVGDKREGAFRDKNDWEQDEGWVSKKVLPCGSIYDGDWKYGRQHGFGRCQYHNGDTYEGYYVNGKKEGHGVYIGKDDKGQYEGEWKEDKMHGIGKWRGPNNVLHEGEYRNGWPEGEGRSTWPNGDVYYGSFAKGKMDGEGKFTQKGGKVYEGEWKRGKRHGHGRLRYADGSEYEGEFLKGRKHGKGCHVRADGWVSHLGLWQDDKPANRS